MAKQIKHTATDKTMTLNELAAFVQDAMRSGADGTEKVKATVAFSGRIKDVTVDVATPAQTSLDKPDTSHGG
ncbi:hypothetical protein [Streptomyces botrytidirepellens]|uniref:Uncharacterized protein n=1 Tax=Streptomyces botrytidirepellens TaxID=2486417 RepID=A0A3M8WX18_9ACTN|nr:hypothetical protein [Streptomyces botrytidirepellens]RNG34307.1 hypothetical protein EEJ42_05680 [Streptomyces botrytidirepellens]